VLEILMFWYRTSGKSQFKTARDLLSPRQVFSRISFGIDG
jgi:hypothetical protein